MRFHYYQFLKLILLAAFAFFLIQLHHTGDVEKLINPKYVRMSQVAAGVIVLLFFVQLGRVWEGSSSEHAFCPPGCTEDHDHKQSYIKRGVSYLVLLFPLFTGFGLNLTSLDAAIAKNKGSLLPQEENSYQVDPSSNSQTLDESMPIPNNNYLTDEEYEQRMDRLNQDDIQMNEDIYASYYQEIQDNPHRYKGRTIQIKGFVYKEEGLESNQLVVARFLITHCVADARVIGLLSESNEAGSLSENTWVEVNGRIDVQNYNGVDIPFIEVKEINQIPEPANPYIFPILTKVL
ncbi:TIGR03943 family putative permease subunit [Halobacillus kuroshimensis]|uniref:TIGR03943 family putative permease subunit n=1 Tax=Halobacillus kuroshimensis TaxID=302481 RepID=UPI0003FBBA37|nr:TIGR03943 family protein [Halobacillus kuroshimensis]